MGLELIGAERGTVFCGDALDYAVGGGDGGAVGGVEALRAGLDEDVIGAKLEGAEFRVAVVTCLAEFGGDGARRELLAVAYLFGCSIDLGDAGEDGASSEAVVHDPLIVIVEVAEDRGEDDQTTKQGNESNPQKTKPEVWRRVGDSGVVTVFDYDWQDALSLDG